MTICTGCPWPESPDCNFCQQEVEKTLVNSADGTVIVRRKSYSRNNHHSMVKERKNAKKRTEIIKAQEYVKFAKKKKLAKKA